MLATRHLVLLLTLAPLACGAPAQDGEESDGTSTASATPTSTPDSTTDSSEETGANPHLDEHGTVKVELVRADPSEDTFAGTSQVVIRLNYMECLSDFYLTSATQWAQSGALGAPVFDGFADLLCDADTFSALTPACSVAETSQDLGGSSSQPSLRVVYNIEDVDLDEKVFHFGPLPVEALTDGCSPLVMLDVGSVRGFNANDEVLWGIESFTAFNEAETNQDGELRVNVSSSSG